MKRFILAVLLLAAFTVTVSAHATIHIYVDTDASGAEDGTSWTDAYTSLADAEGENIDLVTAAEDCVIHCRASSGTADIPSSPITWDGWTTSATYDLTIQCDTADSHAGTWDTTKYRLSFAPGANYEGAIKLNDAHIHLLRLQVESSDEGYSSTFCVQLSAPDSTDIVLDSCIIRGTADCAVYVYRYSHDPTLEIKNAVIFRTDTTHAGSGVFLRSGASVAIKNCTIAGWDKGVYRYENAVTIENSAVFSNTDDFAGTITVSYCASDDGDGTHAQTLDSSSSYANEFTNASGGDFSLVSGSSCIDNGTNTGAPVVDIIGNTRPYNTTTDIGAFEYQGGGTPASPACFHLIFF